MRIATALLLAKVIVVFCCIGLFVTSGVLGKVFSVALCSAIFLGSYVVNQTPQR